MSKNMTRKGLAFGAGLSLIASGFAGLPAQADGITGFIPLVPTSGPATALAIQTSDGASFSVTASPNSTTMAGSGTVKYLVTDPEAKFTPGANTTGGVSESVADNAVVVTNIVDDLVAVTHANASIGDGAYLMWASSNLEGDVNSTGNAEVLLPKDTLVEAFVLGTQVYFKSPTDLTLQIDDVKGANTLNFVKGSTQVSDVDVETTDNDTVTPNADADSLAGLALANLSLGAGTYIIVPDTATAFSVDDGAANALTVAAQNEPLLATIDANGNASFKVDANVTANQTTMNGAVSVVVFSAPSAVRSANNSYVVDTGVTAAGTTASIEVIATDAVSRSVTVQAFVDDFADNEIGASEYVSAPVTLSFLEQADITFSSNLDAPKPGDDKLTGYVTTTPLINDGENDIANWIGGVFTRQDSVTNALVYGGTQNTTTGRWPVEVALATGTVLNHWTDKDTVLDTDENWNKSYTGTTGVDMDNPHTVDGSSAVMDGSTIVVKDKVATVTVRRDDNEISPADADSDADIIAAHFLRVGDKITFEDEAGTAAAIAGKQFTITSVPTASTFTFALDVADGTVQALADFDHAEFEVSTWGTAASGVAVVDRVFAGDYSLTAAVNSDTNKYTAKGVASGLGAQAAVADDIVFTTEASASVQGRTVNDTGAGVDVVAKTGTLSVTVTATVVDKKDAAVGANRPVVYTVARGAHTTIKVNGKTTGDTLRTDANGQVTFTITDTTGAAGKQVTISATAEGVSGSQSDITVKWEDASYKLYDLATTDASLASTTRNIAKNASYDLNLLVADQWLTVAPSADYRVAVSGSGVVEGIATLTDGKATVKVTDAGVSSSYNTVLTLQKKGTTGVFANTTTAVTIAHAVNSSPALVLGAAGSTLYGNAVVTTSPVAKVALVELDKRTDLKTVTPLYVNKAVVNGKATRATTGTALPGSVVTISGPTSILFENGQVAKRGTLTAVADQTTGQFEFNLYSTTAQKDTVITVTANGVSKEIKVTFTGIGVGEGTSLVVTTPAAVQPASTFQVKAKLSDVFGNGVTAAAGRVKVTYTGPGIVFGTLPTSTDANGELMFSVLLGANDSGSISVTVSYDQNGDADYVDAKDLNSSKTIAITASGNVAGEAKVNAGSFKGFVAVYARGYEGKRMSAKIGNDWVIVPALASNFERVTDFTGAGVSIEVRIFIDRVLVGTFPLVTK